MIYTCQQVLIMDHEFMARVGFGIGLGGDAVRTTDHRRRRPHVRLLQAARICWALSDQQICLEIYISCKIYFMIKWYLMKCSGTDFPQGTLLEAALCNRSMTAVTMIALRCLVGFIVKPENQSKLSYQKSYPVRFFSSLIDKYFAYFLFR